MSGRYDFLIADTFTDSLARLTGDEQKAVKTTAFDLQMDPSAPGLSFHKLDKAKDRRFWSVRVNSDIRLIVHRTDASLLLCYVDHHDRAYAWAERRKLETHPTTGAAQIIELRESVREIVVPTYVHSGQVTTTTVKPLVTVSDEQLLGYGVPSEWLADVRQADEDGLLVLAQHLPAEAAEAVLELATGGTPRPAQPEPTTDPFAHPDAQRRFRVVTSIEELERALDAPWDKWAVFLHPEQRQLVTRDYAGPARVAGSAGTGKTVVALHRAVHLARRNPDGRVLLATFSEPLAHALRANVRRLIGNEPRVAERLEVHAMSSLGLRLHQAQIGPVRLASNEEVGTLLREASQGISDHKFSSRFLRTEWDHVVDAWQLSTWDAYRDVQRLGRRTRLGFGDYRLDERVPTLEESLRTPRASTGQPTPIAVGYEPGSRWQYSGGGYLILQLLVEEVTQQPFAAFMRQAVFDPLKLQCSSFESASSPNAAEAYDAAGRAAPRFQYAAAGATGFSTCVRDMVRWVQAQVQGGPTAPLDADLLRRMREPHGRQFGADIWGLGTMLYAPTAGDAFVFGHDGQNEPAINAAVRINPDNGDAIVVLTSGGRRLATRLAAEWTYSQTGGPDFLVIGTAIREAVVPLVAGWAAVIVAAMLYARARRRATRHTG